MRKIIMAVLICVLLWPAGISVSAESAAPQVSAYAAVLYDPVTKTVLFEKNSRKVLPMASTTKIMTALLAFESGRADEAVEITPEMTAVEGSSMGLLPGDVLPLREIARGMMMASGNDGANAIALFLGGTAEGFAAKMNARAAEIGMMQTHFVTASGLDAEGHGSTAYDMALLAAEAMACPAFSETVGQFSLMVEFTQPAKRVRYDNHNKLLTLYEGCTGVKTGFTKKAGRCLVSSAQRDGVELICVTLNAPDDWNDHTALFDYGFGRFSEQVLQADTYAVPVVGGEREKVLCAAENLPAVKLPAGVQAQAEITLRPFVYAPVAAGEVLGTAAVTVNGRTLVEVPLRAQENIQVQTETRGGFLDWLRRVFR